MFLKKNRNKSSFDVFFVEISNLFELFKNAKSDILSNRMLIIILKLI